MRRTWVGVVAVLVLGASCARDGADQSGAPKLVPMGTVSLVRGGDTVTVSEPLTLLSGDLIRSGADGGARIEWPDGRSVELAPETQLDLEAPVPELLTGSALVQAPQGLTLSAGAAEIDGHGGVFRLDRGVNLRVGVYEGVAVLPRSGWDGEIGALSEAFVTALAGTVAQEPQPLEISAGDPWDERLLGDAIDVGLRLADLQRGLGAQLRGRSDAALDALDDDFRRAQLRRLLNRVAAAELVVAAQAALLAADVHDVPAGAALNEILAFRAEGASWPLVVAQWGLEREALLAAVVRVSGAITERVRAERSGAGGREAAGDRGASAGPAPAAGGGGPAPTTGGGTPPSGGGTPPSGGGTPPGGGGDPPPPEDPPPPPRCDGTVDCLIDDVLDVATGVSTP